MARPARVLLVGYEDQDNLGLRYLAASLRAAGHEARFARFDDGPRALLEPVRGWRPDLVGFSMIFQFLAPAFAEAVAALRADGCAAHLTMGGHYASFEPGALLELMPGLDSVVRFEGEGAIVALADALAFGRPWRGLPGLAWRADGELRIGPPREPVADLDELPWPVRDDLDYRAQALPTASVLASRGCPWRCSFCSIVPFYAGNGTRGRRRRDPARVVDEIEHLVRGRGARLLLFQDDDFLAGGPAATAWALEVGRRLVERGLHREQRFKFSCRSDEIREDVLAPLVEAGLAHVYLGVEAGDPRSLEALDKRITPDVHLRAGETLRRLGLSFDFGFMLLEPWSTLATVRGNLAFLREFCADGAAVAGFCRALPYAGTPMERRLREEGRLAGPALEADYAFLDPRLDALWDFSLVAFTGRNHGADATWDRLRGLLFEASLDWPERPRDPDFLQAARLLAAASNELLVDAVEEALEVLEDRPGIRADDARLLDAAVRAREGDARVRGLLDALWLQRPREIEAELFR